VTISKRREADADQVICQKEKKTESATVTRRQSKSTDVVRRWTIRLSAMVAAVAGSGVVGRGICGIVVHMVVLVLLRHLFGIPVAGLFAGDFPGQIAEAGCAPLFFVRQLLFLHLFLLQKENHALLCDDDVLHVVEHFFSGSRIQRYTE
jgi:hypothetical protein